MDNQQPKPKGKVQRLFSLREVGYKRLISEMVRPQICGEDIVCTRIERLGWPNGHGGE